MNKIVFDAKILDLWSTDYEYLQDSIEDELRKIYRQTIINAWVTAIIRGFDLQVSPTDPSTVMIYHNTSTGFSRHGALLTENGDIIETTSEIDLIEPSDPTAGVANYVYVRLYKVSGSFNKHTGEVVEDEQTAIDLYDYKKVYDREVDKYEVVVYTRDEVLALTQEELEELVFIGSFIANGGGTVYDISYEGRVYAGTFIQPESIREWMFSPDLLIAQTYIDNSETYDDDYSGTPDNLEDDLNRLRTEIRAIKGTDSWEDETADNLSSFDFSVNALHPDGILPFGTEFQCIPTSTGVRILSGKTLIGGEVFSVQSSTGLTVDVADIYDVGDWDTRTTTEAHLVGSHPDSFNLVHGYVTNLRITESPMETGTELDVDVDFTVDLTTGVVSTTLSGDMHNETVYCWYEWSLPRIDLVQVSSTGVFSIKKGVSSLYAVPPIPDDGNMRAYYLMIGVGEASLDPGDIIDCRQDTKNARSVYEINADDYETVAVTPNKFTYFKDTSEIDTSFEQWVLTSTSTGEYATTSTGGAYLETLIYSVSDGELWVSSTIGATAGTMRVSYASVANSETLDQYVDVVLTDNHTINDVIRMITSTLTHGYHLVRVTNISGVLTFSSVYYGNLDLKYLKSIVADGVVAENATIDSLSSVDIIADNSIDTVHVTCHDLYIDWLSSTGYIAGSIIQYNGKVLICKGAHTSSSNFTADYLLGYWGIINSTELDILQSKITTLKNELDDERRINLEQELTLGYITGRRSNVSSLFTELFNNKENTNTEIAVTSKCEIKDDNDWNDNWISAVGVNYNGGIEFKQGFLRPAKQAYMLEPIESYDLYGVGQANKGAISKYDSQRECYWMISCKGVNDIGEITQISRSMISGKVVINARWYLEAGGSSTNWSGIDLGSYESGGVTYDALFIILCGANTASKIVKIPVNEDGTLGKAGYERESGGSFSLDELITSQLAADRAQSAETGYYNDVIDYDEDNVLVVNCNGTTVSLIAHAKSNLGQSVSDNITGFGSFVGGTTSVGRTLAKSENYLFFRVNDSTDSFRNIFTFDIDNDITSNVVYSASGRFQVSRESSNSSLGSSGGCEGITVSYDGYILEVTSTAAAGTFIAKRSFSNALWGESQVSGMYPMRAAPNYNGVGTSVPATPKACMVDASGWYYTGDSSAAASQARIIRYKETGVANKCTLTGTAGGQTITGIVDLCTDGTNVWLLLVSSTSEYHIHKGLLSDLTTALNAANGSISISSGDWPACDNDSTVTNEKTGICYDVDEDLLYILNDGATDKIDSLTTTSTGVYTEDVYDLPAPVGADKWGGIASFGDNIYVVDSDATVSSPAYIYVLDKISGTTAAYKFVHMYQDPSHTFSASVRITGICLNDENDLLCVNTAVKSFFLLKTLDNPDVLQLNSYLDVNNGLFTSQVVGVTKIVRRETDPNDFTEFLQVDASGSYDPNASPTTYSIISSKRNVPNDYYFGVCYANNGFSLVHLDEFLSRRSVTGKNRYDIRDLIIQHSWGAANNLCDDVAFTSRSIDINKDVVFLGSDFGVNIIFLKTGKALMLDNGTKSGFQYGGAFSQRNDGSTYSGQHDPNLDLSYLRVNTVFSRTFTKEDTSDYNGAYPKTCVVLGTGDGDSTGKADLLVITWGEDGNPAAMKVWNDIFNGVSFVSNAVWIAPSGRIFGGVTDVGGEGTEGGIYYSNKYAFDISEDGTSAAYTQVGSAILTDSVWKISPQSRCWKTASGTWRHVLLCSTYRSNSKAKISLVDVESATIETIHDIGTSGTYFYATAFEDIVFGVSSASDASAGINIYKKNRFGDSSIASPSGSSWSLYQITNTTRPFFDPKAVVASGSNSDQSNLVYSPEIGMLMLATGKDRLSMLHLNYQLDFCRHESVENDCANPSECLYTLHAILPESA
jgi:hypothetical protein